MSTTFNSYAEGFKTNPLWQRMQETVEASPWHREANTAVHTEMTLREFGCTGFHLPIHDQLLGQLALLFHDTGKPVAKEVKTREDGTTYNSFAGHEPISAALFTQEWLSDPVLRSLVSKEDARKVRWLIENHLPYGMRDTQKRSRLFTDAGNTLGNLDLFFAVLRADAAGRISDDHTEKLTKVEDWIAAFRQVQPVTIKIDPGMGTCYLLVGPSGSGKTTWINEFLKVRGAYVFSMDQSRLDLYTIHGHEHDANPKVAYDTAWEYANEHEKEFNAFWQNRVRTMFKDAVFSKMPIIIDYTSLSRKRRSLFVQLARERGMPIQAIEFWVPLETLLKRQETRPEKKVPRLSIMQQMHAQSCCALGVEADIVEIKEF